MLMTVKMLDDRILPCKKVNTNDIDLNVQVSFELTHSSAFINWKCALLV